MSARRLLIVSYWYPPAVGAAAERIFSFARYLPEHEWDLHVLTAERWGPILPMPGATVHPVDDPLGPNVPSFADYDPRRRPGRLQSWLRDRLFPDRFIHWAVAAARHGVEIASSTRLRLMLVSFPPASAVLAALQIHHRTGLPFVVDLRDRWFGPGGYEPRSPRAATRHRALENEAMTRAAGILTVSEPMAEAAVEEHGIPRDRVFVIPNGFEDDHVPGKSAILPRNSVSPIVVAHVGTVIARNRPERFFESLRRLHAAGKLANARFQFVGNLSPEYVRSLGLEALVATTGLVSRDEARRAMRDADALLLLTGEYVGRWGVSAKLFEYLRAGRPILCLEERPGSNDRAILEDLAPRRARFAPMDDPDAIAEQVVRLTHLRANRESVAEPLAPELERFDRRRIAARLAAALSAVVRA